GIPDSVMPDQNGDGIPEIDLNNDGRPDFGYIPEKWSKDTSKIFAHWPKVSSSYITDYQVGLGVSNMSNNVTNAINPATNGWFSTNNQNEYELSNLALLSSHVTKLNQ